MCLTMIAVESVQTVTIKFFDAFLHAINAPSIRKVNRSLTLLAILSKVVLSFSLNINNPLQQVTLMTYFLHAYEKVLNRAV